MFRSHDMFRDSIERREGQGLEGEPKAKKRIVLTTTDIQSVYQDQRRGDTEPNGTYVEQRAFKTCTHFSYSTGVLEKVLQRGYEVYVISTRDELFSTDDWWVALVGRDRVFLTPRAPAAEGNEGRQRRFLEPYRQLFEALGITFAWEGFHRDLLTHLPEFGIDTMRSVDISTL